MHKPPFTLPITKITTDSPRVKSFFFKTDLDFQAGQFFMVWVPGVGERPLSAYKDGDTMILSVANVGTVSNAIHESKVEDSLRFRGPFGNPFSLPEEKGSLIMVAGGYGIVPLAMIARQAKEAGFEPVILNGARTNVEALYQERMKEEGVAMELSTDDGSAGRKGYVHELLEEYLKTHEKPVRLFVCGPEVMENAVAQVCYKHDIDFQVSVERYMKCGVGVCGSCCVDSTGWRMCVEGPVISGEQLKQITEFGKYHRGPSGKKL
jgi:dihydroorotate dehydrogenase electron transfer subunit